MMPEKRVAFLLSVLLILALNTFPGQEKTVRDDMGFVFTPGPPPQRIVSLAPNITEILFALGLGDRIAGVTRFCDFPPEAAAVDKIGGMIDLSLEKIHALNPDLVIGFRGNPVRILERLRSLGLPVFVLDMGGNLDSLFPVIEKIGRITGREDESAILIRSLKKKSEDVEATLRKVNRKPRVFLSLHGRGFWTCGNESFLHDLINRAGGVNIAGEIPKRWLLLNREQIIHQDPEVIVVMASSRSEFERAEEWLKNKSLLETVQAVRNGKIFFLEENPAARFGPRLFDALSRLAAIIHPELFVEGS